MNRHKYEVEFSNKEVKVFTYGSDKSSLACWKLVVTEAATYAFKLNLTIVAIINV